MIRPQRHKFQQALLILMILGRLPLTGASEESNPSGAPTSKTASIVASFVADDAAWGESLIDPGAASITSGVSLSTSSGPAKSDDDDASTTKTQEKATLDIRVDDGTMDPWNAWLDWLQKEEDVATSPTGLNGFVPTSQRNRADDVDDPTFPRIGIGDVPPPQPTPTPRPQPITETPKPAQPTPAPTPETEPTPSPKPEEQAEPQEQKEEETAEPTPQPPPDEQKADSGENEKKEEPQEQPPQEGEPPADKPKDAKGEDDKAAEAPKEEKPPQEENKKEEPTAPAGPPLPTPQPPSSEELIKADLSKRMISVEVMVIAISTAYERAIGIEYSEFKRDWLKNPDEIVKGVDYYVPTSFDTVTIPRYFPAENSFIKPNNRVARLPGLGLRFLGTDIDTEELQIDLRLLMTQGKAEFQGRITALTMSARPVSVHVGEAVPFRGEVPDPKKGTTRYGVGQKDSGIKVNLTPNLLANGIVDLNINEISINTIARRNDRGAATTFDFNTNNITKAGAMVSSGETLILGTLQNDREIVTESRVPILGAIPIIGLLFKSKSLSTEARDILFFITPTVLEPDESPILPTDFENRIPFGIEEKPPSPGFWSWRK